MSKTYIGFYKKFEKFLMDKEDTENLENVRRLSDFLVFTPENITRLCFPNGVADFPEDWNPEGSWNLQFN